MGFDSNLSCMLTIPMKEKSAENVVQAYLSGILAHKGRRVAILSDNDTEFRNIPLNKICDQIGIKGYFINLFHHQGNAKLENVHNFLKRTPAKFLDSGDLDWNELFPFTCYCLLLVSVQQKDTYLT